MDLENQELCKRMKQLEGEITILKEQRKKITEQLGVLDKEYNRVKSKYNLNLSSVQERDWKNDKFAWTENVLKILKDTFKLPDFRDQQLAAINIILSKRDLLLLMPTGGGKSLCYQLPALVSKGLTVVVSPLLSLIEDQLISLKKLNISAYSINSSTSSVDKQVIFKWLNKAEGPPIYFLYITPEWLSKSNRFMAALQKCHARGQLDRFAIDEVHCCSTWGHDFRKDYGYLSMFKILFPNVKIIGVTATASTNVLLDVQEMLGIEGCTILKAPFDRPNLYFEVISKSEKMEGVVHYFKEAFNRTYQGATGIIYTSTIKDCTQLASVLKENDLKVACYHADLPKERRLKVHHKWMNNEYRAIVATVAFGMGIDKPDVRFVIHYSVPKSIENLYQEAGRAGRNGERADCVVMFRLADYMKNSSYAKSKTEIKNCGEVLKYCINLTGCRHKLMGKHFEVSLKDEPCKKMCDNCTNSNRTGVYNIVKAYEQILKIIRNGELNFTLNKLMDSWLKNKSVGTYLNHIQAEYIIGNLLALEYLTESRSYSAYAVYCYLKENAKVIVANNRIDTVLFKSKSLETFFADSLKRCLEDEDASTSKKRK